MIILAIASWWFIGFAAFVFDWTREYDLELADAMFGIFVGVLGPIAFLPVLCNYVLSIKGNIIVFKKRGSN